ncbi:hypothetical protein FOZ62_017550, partial [Perkinsus olseni]
YGRIAPVPSSEDTQLRPATDAFLPHGGALALRNFLSVVLESGSPPQIFALSLDILLKEHQKNNVRRDMPEVAPRTAVESQEFEQVATVLHSPADAGTDYARQLSPPETEAETIDG